MMTRLTLSLDSEGASAPVSPLLQVVPVRAAVHTQGIFSFPGRWTADASVWSAVATMLATLDFNPLKDANGKDIEFEAEFTNGVSQ